MSQKKRFTHLNCHSNFSLLYGGSTLDDLISRCAETGMEALALTDRDGLYGAVEFFEKAEAAGIKPIVGCDLPVNFDREEERKTPGRRLVLLAQNEEGYRNLCRVVTEMHLGESPPTPELLSHHRDGLFALCRHPELLPALAPIFGEMLYAELANLGNRESHLEAEALMAEAGRLKLSCTASNRVAFALPADYQVHRVLSAIRLIRPVTHLPREEVADRECYLKSPEEMEELFASHPYTGTPEALEAAHEISEACEFRFRLGEHLFPTMELPEGETPFSHLTKLCFAGASRRYQPFTRSVLERLHYELDIIERLGFAQYFLIVHDIVGFCRERGIPAAGRGSAAGSLVAYVLGITYIDPLEHELYFERFLSPARDDCPDIDLDISWNRRDEVLDFIYHRFGSDRVAMICTYATMKARMAVREVAKCLGLPPEEIGEFAKRLPHCKVSQLPAAARMIPSCQQLPLEREPYRTILDICRRIDRYPRHLSIHAGGVIIGDRPLTDLVPLERAAKGLVITQYDMGPIERLGLVKMDILGQKGLSVITETAVVVEKNRGARVDTDDLPRDDPLTFRLLREGRTLGVFQIESPGMRSLLKALRPDTIEDLTLSIALIRPGAAGSGMKELYLLRRAGKEPLVYLHPELEPILAESLGTFVYQEQVMRAARAIAGFSLAEADELRRAMTKQRSREQMEEVRERFLNSAAARGVPPEVARAVFESLAKFAGYGFPKAHAATYGEFAYQAAYLKAHYPAEFMAAVLSNRAGFYHHSVYLEEARRLGVPLELPHINLGEAHEKVVDGVLYLGLSRVKGLSQRSIESILTARKEFPFTSLSDFLTRVSITEEETASLIKCGALDSLENTRPELLWKLKLVYPRAREARKAREGLGVGAPLGIRGSYERRSGGEVDRGSSGETGPESTSPATRDQPLPLYPGPLKVSPPQVLPRIPDYGISQKLEMELVYLEACISRHPLEVLVPEVPPGTTRSLDLEKHAGESVELIGWLIAQRRAVTKKGEYMQFLTLEDLHGTFEVILFPRDYQRLGERVPFSRAFRVKGKVHDQCGSPSVVASDLVPLAFH